MILADKIIRLRKKNGWSQEELADKMNVSRQAVSKWESSQTIPDLDKILQLSTLFGVTTDYLLKDEIEDEEFSDDVSSDTTVKRITKEEWTKAGRLGYCVRCYTTSRFKVGSKWWLSGYGNDSGYCQLFSYND